MLARDALHQIQDVVREHGNVEILIWGHYDYVNACTAAVRAANRRLYVIRP
jgi:hypothetical protein